MGRWMLKRDCDSPRSNPPPNILPTGLHDPHKCEPATKIWPCSPCKKCVIIHTRPGKPNNKQQRLTTTFLFTIFLSDGPGVPSFVFFFVSLRVFGNGRLTLLPYYSYYYQSRHSVYIWSTNIADPNERQKCNPLTFFILDDSIAEARAECLLRE